MNCISCNREIQDDAVFCGYCGARQQNVENPENGGGRIPQGPEIYGRTEPPMKWFKFIIYFQLFAFAVLTVMDGIRYMNGMIYEGYAPQVYLMYPGMKTVDMIFGVVCFLLAGYAIYVRQGLANFKAAAVKQYYAFLIAGIAYSLISIVVVSIVTGVSIGSIIGTDVGIIANIAIRAIIIFANITYFKKRSHLFVN